MKRALFFVLGLIFGAFVSLGFILEPESETVSAEEYKEEIIELSIEETEAVKEQFDRFREREAKETYIDQDTVDELLLLAKCVEAEAGNQDLLGKRLVVDVILNRVDSKDFPDSIEGVIKQSGQFSVWPNGMNKEPTESTWKAVHKELESRVDDMILYFRPNHYHSWCIPAYQHGDHYFGY